MTLKAAIAVSLSGRFSALGKKALHGARLWADYSGAQLEVEDDRGLPERAAEITKGFCADKTVDAVLGPYSSSLVLAAARAASLTDKTLWNHGGADDKISRYGNVVSSITPAGKYFEPVVEILAQNAAGKVVVAAPAGSGFSEAVAGGAIRRAAALEMDVSRVSYNPDAGAQSVLDLVGGADALLSVGRMEDDMELAEKVFGMRVRPGFLCFVAAGVDEFRKRFGDRCEGVFSVSQWEKDSAPEADFGPSAAEFSEMFIRRYGHAPDYPSAQAFNIGLIVERCGIEAGSTDDKDLRRAAKSLDFTTFYGRFKTDANGTQTGRRMTVTKWRGGKRVVVEPMGFEPTTSTLPVLRSPD